MGNSKSIGTVYVPSTVSGYDPDTSYLTLEKTMKYDILLKKKLNITNCLTKCNTINVSITLKDKKFRKIRHSNNKK
jgi:hypothetical protein